VTGRKSAAVSRARLGHRPPVRYSDEARMAGTLGALTSPPICCRRRRRPQRLELEEIEVDEGSSPERSLLAV